MHVLYFYFVWHKLLDAGHGVMLITAQQTFHIWCRQKKSAVKTSNLRRFFAPNGFANLFGGLKRTEFQQIRIVLVKTIN